MEGAVHALRKTGQKIGRSRRKCQVIPIRSTSPANNRMRQFVYTRAAAPVAGYNGGHGATVSSWKTIYRNRAWEGCTPTLTFPTNGMRARSHNSFLCNAGRRTAARYRSRPGIVRFRCAPVAGPMRLFNITFEDIHFPVHGAALMSAVSTQATDRPIDRRRTCFSACMRSGIAPEMTQATGEKNPCSRDRKRTTIANSAEFIAQLLN